MRVTLGPDVVQVWCIISNLVFLILQLNKRQSYVERCNEPVLCHCRRRTQKLGWARLRLTMGPSVQAWGRPSRACQTARSWDPSSRSPRGHKQLEKIIIIFSKCDQIGRRWRIFLMDRKYPKHCKFLYENGFQMESLNVRETFECLGQIDVCFI